MRSARLPLPSPAGGGLALAVGGARPGRRLPRSPASIASIGESLAFERDGQPRDFGGDVVDALAQQRVLHPLGGPGLLGLALHGGDFLLQLGALGLRLGELILDQRLFLGRGFRWRRGCASRPTRARRAGRLSVFCAAAILSRSWAHSNSRSERTRICSAMPRFQLLHAAAEHLGFGGLRHQRAFELHHPVARASRPCRAPR